MECSRREEVNRGLFLLPSVYVVPRLFPGFLRRAGFRGADKGQVLILLFLLLLFHMVLGERFDRIFQPVERPLRIDVVKFHYCPFFADLRFSASARARS